MRVLPASRSGALQRHFVVTSSATRGLDTFVLVRLLGDRSCNHSAFHPIMMKVS